MKKCFMLLIFILTLNLSFSQNIEYAKSIVKTLSSSEFQGRGYTGNGNFLAAEYISNEYKRLGLLPFANTYYQKFHFPANTFPDNVSLKLNNEALQPGKDFLIDASSPGIKGKFNLLKIRREDINSKEKLALLVNKIGDMILFIDDIINVSEDKIQVRIINDNIAYLKYSSEIKCKGIVINTREKLTWDASSQLTCRPIIYINKILDLNSIHNIEINIQNKFIHKFNTQNVIGYIKGTIQPDSFLLIIGHYDHLGTMGKDCYFPGANDNASGIAMLLNMAEHYSKHPPKYSILFISLSGEEIGLLGAKEFAEHPLIPLNKIKFLVNFDLAGTGDEGIRIVNGSIFKDKFDLLSRINSEYHLLPKIDIRGEVCNSDHCIFYRKGVKCFYIYTQGGIKAYHDIFDKAETLPLTAFINYNNLMIKFFDSF